MRIFAKRTAAFTLVELLTVMGVILLIVALMVPALKSIKGSGDVTSAAYSISGLIENARSYAMTNSTYVWVGFYEENAGTTTPTAATPSYSGKGQVVLAAVYSVDGTTSCQNSTATVSSPIVMTAKQLLPLGKITKVQNLHLADVGAPTLTVPSAQNTLDGRPALAYTYGSPTDHFNRISSDSSDSTAYPFVAQGYTFYKTLQFSPRGEVSINGLPGLKPLVEIGLQPTNGSVPDANSKNLVAIQVTGVAGSVKIYRR